MLVDINSVMDMQHQMGSKINLPYHSASKPKTTNSSQLAFHPITLPTKIQYVRMKHIFLIGTVLVSNYYSYQIKELESWQNQYEVLSLLPTLPIKMSTAPSPSVEGRISPKSTIFVVSILHWFLAVEDVDALITG
jgi:hypothetical protein